MQDDLTPNQRAGILALLEHRTVQEAAKALEVNPATLWRWMAAPAFAEALREAQGRAFDDGIERLRGVAGAAAEALARNLKCGIPATEVRAAQIVLELGFRAREQAEFADRLAALEDRITSARPAGTTRTGR